MFQPGILKTLIDQFKPMLSDLAAVEAQLNLRFYGMEESIHALILAAACGEPLLLIGSPGTAKSLLIREFCRLVGLNVDQSEDNDAQPVVDEDYFEYLLTPFTEPGELFGIVNVKNLREGDYVRIEKGMLQRAKVVYLDEVFNASSAILNSVLAVMNEGRFHDFGKIKKVKMQCLFAATNHLKITPELRAFADRFVLRCYVDNIEPEAEHMGGLLEKGWMETYGQLDTAAFPGLLEELEGFREAIRQQTGNGKLKPDRNHEMMHQLSEAVEHLRRNRYSEMSNRRLVKMSRIMLVHALYRAVVDKHPNRPAVEGPELDLIYKYFLDRRDPELAKYQHTMRQDWQHKQNLT